MLNHSWRKVKKLNPTKLHLEIQSSNPKIGEIEKLIKGSRGVNLVSENLTPLLLAVQKGRKEVVELFLRHSTNVDFNVTDGYYGILHLAAQKDVSAFPVKELFEKYSNLITSGKININAKDYRDQTPLHIAASEHKIEWVQCLLKNGADLHAKDIDGNTPLYLAAKPLNLDGEVQYDPEFIKLKQKEQANVIEAFLNSRKVNINDPVDSMNNTLLHLAVVSDNNFMLSKLLEYKSNINIVNNDDLSPFTMAVAYQKVDALKLLLEYSHKHNIDMKFDDTADVNGRNALHTAIENNFDIRLINRLVKNGLDPNVPDNSGYTALHYAADYSNNPKLLDLLMQHGANPKIKNKEGQTPLNIAKQYDNQETIKVLEKALKNSEKKASKQQNISQTNTNKPKNIGKEVSSFLKKSIIEPIIKIMQR